MPREITPHTTLDNLKREAKRWLKALREGDAEARGRFDRAYPKHAGTHVLRDLQHALAREHGLENWNQLKVAVQQAARSRNREAYEQAARDFVDAWAGDATALERLNRHYNRSFSLSDVRTEVWRRDYEYRRRSSRMPERDHYFPLEEAQAVVAQDAGFNNWQKLMDAVAHGEPPQGGPYVIDAKENSIGPRRRLSAADWDELIGVMKERRIPTLNTHGLVTDEALRSISELDFVTSLSLGGTSEFTDDGLLQLARMPQLERLDLHDGKLTDRGLEVLGHLPNLRNLDIGWQASITDRGIASLRACGQLEGVNLMGTRTGDGAIEALQGKVRLRRFTTGFFVSDAGIPLLHNFPLLKTADKEGASLLIDGPFTNTGLAALAGLDGLFELALFWHVRRITTDAYSHLRLLPNLISLSCDGRLSDDVALSHIAAMPRLKRLQIQESVATDAGFETLGRSQTIEQIWGRVCQNFGRRGFLAFSRMPSLRTLGIGCKNVDDVTLAALPEFPALRELTPIDFRDDGFRRIGRCPNLERLQCMYCGETGDAGTEHIKDLAIRYYYAGCTQIGDRSLEILGGMESLEQVDLYGCQKVTDAGLPFLARLPKLREVRLDGMPDVTLKGTSVFRPRTHVHHST
jgi:hypothetical protein